MISNQLPPDDVRGGFKDTGMDWLTKTMLQEITRSSKEECSTGDQTIILGLQILVHERSSSMLHVDGWTDGMGWMDVYCLLL